MRRALTLICIAALFGVANTQAAIAQSSHSSEFSWTNGTTGNDYFGLCAQRDRDNPQRTLRSCSRLIGDRQSGAVTAGAYYFRGQTYLQMHDRDRARADFEQAYSYFSAALSNDRRNPDAYANRAAVLYELGRYGEALADYDAALAVSESPTDGLATRVRSAVADRRRGQIAELQYSRGKSYFGLGDWANAIAAFDQAATLVPEEGAYQGARCAARAAASVQLDVAQEACDEGMRLDAANSDVLFYRGFFYFSGGRFDAAFADFAAAIANDEEDFRSLYARGATAVRLGREAEGQADMRSASAELMAEAITYYENAGLRP